MSLGEFKGCLNALPIGAPKTNKKALIPLGIRAFPKLAFSSCGADGTARAPRLFLFSQALLYGAEFPAVGNRAAIFP